MERCQVVCPVCKKPGSETYSNKEEVLGKIVKCGCLGGGRQVKLFVEEKHLKLLKEEGKISGIQKENT